MSNDLYVVTHDVLSSHQDTPMAFCDFRNLSSKLGAKAAGLVAIPIQWCPDFTVISTNHYQQWLDTQVVDDQVISFNLDWVVKNGFKDVIIRSSGVNEKIGDRGKYQSVVIRSPVTGIKIKDAITQVYTQAVAVDKDDLMGIIVQHYIPPSLSGHLSNEVRVSPTRNQWKYELETPTWSPSKGLNSTLAPLPDISSPIFCGKKIPHQGLRSVGKWINGNVKPRCHVEWFTAHDRLYLVQLDLEWSELDEGFNPKLDFDVGSNVTPDLSKVSALNAYKIGESTPWKKLENLSIFDFDEETVGPNLFLLSAVDFLTISKSKKDLCCFIEEVRAVTADRAVVRTDCKDPKARSFNLPRTDTVQASEVPKWCEETIDKLKAEDIDVEDIAFLIHAFLPSSASAWAYAIPGNPTVIVDALWGLPDGLQVLPVDTYEVNIERQKIIATKSTFKPRFLQEDSDGNWVYQSILRSKGRSKVLTPKAVLEVASRTANIADKLEDDAQIMWFCGIPKEYGVGKNIPWFRSREKFDAAPRVETRYKIFEVRNPKDLERLPDRQATIKLSPEVDLIRDDDFLQKIIDVALAKKLPVQLDGSMLGHTYYRLSQAGVGIVLANAPKYYRKRETRVFGKIVRDKITANIQSGGESVREAFLDKADIAHGLVGKMLEELEEYLLAKNKDDKKSELADVLEVLKGLAKSDGIDWDEITSFAKKKRGKRGGFEERKVLLETSLPKAYTPLNSIPTIKITQIGNFEILDDVAKIPLTALVNSIGRAGIRLKIMEQRFSVDLSIRNGRLHIAPTELVLRTTDSSQLGLFDENLKT